MEEELDIDIESEQVNNYSVEDNNAELVETSDSVNKSKDSRPNQRHKFLRLPLSRIKTIMKKDPDCSILSQDAAFLATKATEMFIDYLARESAKQLVTMGKRKTITKKDVESVVQNIPHLCFLDGALE